MSNTIAMDFTPLAKTWRAKQDEPSTTDPSGYVVFDVSLLDDKQLSYRILSRDAYSPASSNTTGPQTGRVFCGSIMAQFQAGLFMAQFRAPTAWSEVYVEVARSSRPQDPAGFMGPNPAEVLRALSGITVDRLAGLLQISRPTFYTWLKGGSIGRRHLQRLLQVVAVIRSAYRVRGSAEAVGRWLVDPIDGAVTTPWELLRAGDYATAGGLALVPTIAQPIEGQSRFGYVKLAERMGKPTRSSPEYMRRWAALRSRAAASSDDD